MIAGDSLAYLFAKICGYARTARLGSNAVALAASSTLRGLYEAVTGRVPPSELTSSAVLREIESFSRDENSRSYDSVEAVLGSKLPFFHAMKRKSEFETLSRLIQAVRSGAKALPPFLSKDELAPFMIEAWPDLVAMTEGTRYEGVVAKNGDDTLLALNALDRQYWTELWAAMLEIPGRLREGLADVVALELEMQNVVWALRLSVYYRYDKEAAGPLLVSLPGRDVTKRALEVFDRNTQEQASWARWRWAFLSGTRDKGGFWNFDVRSFEKRAFEYALSRARKAMHANPFTLLPAYYFIKLREAEMNTVMGIAEGLRMGMPMTEILSGMEVPA